MKQLLLLLFLLSSLSAMSGPEHLSLWEIVSSIPINRGGFGNEFSKPDRKLLHKFIDLRYDHSPLDKRHLPSHNARLMGKIFGDHWNAGAVRNAVALHAVADMYNSHRSDTKTKAGVNGHAYSIKRGREAEKIVKALKEGKSVRYPKWAYREGGRFKYDKAVISALKNQAHEIIWLKKITTALKAAPYIYYSAQAGRLCYLYGVDRELGEEEALYFLTGALSGGAIFHSSTALLTMGSSTLASVGVGGAIVTFVLPTALSVAGVYALEQYLKSENINSFEDLADLLGEFPPFLRELYETGSKDTRKQMRKLNRSYRSLVRDGESLIRSIQKGAESLSESAGDLIEAAGDQFEKLEDQVEYLSREIKRALP